MGSDQYRVGVWKLKGRYLKSSLRMRQQPFELRGCWFFNSKDLLNYQVACHLEHFLGENDREIYSLSSIFSLPCCFAYKASWSRPLHLSVFDAHTLISEFTIKQLLSMHSLKTNLLSFLYCFP